MLDLYLHQLAAMSRDEAESAVRERVQTAYLGDELLLARVLGRYKMLLRTSDRGFACHLMLDGYWEMWITLFIARYLKPGMTVIDVGANFGYYSLLFADAVTSTGAVIAVEPNPSTADILAETLTLNGFIDRTRIERAALGREAHGTARLFVPKGEPKNATVLPVAGRAGQHLEVPTTSLDSLTHGLDRVDFIKIDAEGAEADIVAGMPETLARFRPALILEFNAARLSDPAVLLDRLVAVYGGVRTIGFGGKPQHAEPGQLLKDAARDDVLLFFS